MRASPIFLKGVEIMGKIKEFLKDWLVEHERLYWYIVVGLAVLAFGIITMMGFAKLEKAEAATDVSVNWAGSVGTHTVYDLTDFDWISRYTGDFTAEQIISECSAFMVRKTSSDRLYYYFLKEPIFYNDVSTGQMNFALNVGDFIIEVALLDGVWCVTSCKQVSNSSNGWFVAYNSGQNFLLGSTYDYFANNIQTNIDKQKETMPRNNLSYPKVLQYSLDAPYVKFDSLDIVAPLATTPYDLKLFKDVPAEYADYSNWYWQYNGHIENPLGIVSDEYSLNMAFTCQFPTFEHIFAFWDDCVDQRTLLKKTPLSVREWMAKDLEFETYKFQHSFVLDVDDDGSFSLKIPYSVIHAFLVYANHDLLNLYGSCTEEDIDFCDVMMSYLYVSDITMCLETTADNSVYYGRTILNHFSKGITNKAVVSEVLIDVSTATPEELDAAISAALQKGFQDALKDTQDQINNMQNDLDSIFEVDGALSGNLEGSDLWVGFSNLAEGLASLAPSISALSVLTGAVFGFLPMTITGIMSFTLLAICIIAIIKAIRG